jgi:hypothetical protein
MSRQFCIEACHWQIVRETLLLSSLILGVLSKSFAQCSLGEVEDIQLPSRGDLEVGIE